MLKVSNLNINTGCRTSEQSLLDSLEISRCRTDRLESILYPFLQVLDVSDFVAQTTEFRRVQK